MKKVKLGLANLDCEVGRPYKSEMEHPRCKIPYSESRIPSRDAGCPIFEQCWIEKLPQGAEEEKKNVKYKLLLLAKKYCRIWFL